RGIGRPRAAEGTGPGGPREARRGDHPGGCDHHRREPGARLLAHAGAGAADGTAVTHHGGGDGQEPVRVPGRGRMIAKLVEQILKELGEDAQREGLAKTPERVEAALKYLTSGYDMKVEDVLNDALFVENYDEMVIVKDIDFNSVCEHHILPFIGKCHVAYMPRQKIVGLSKIPRLVDMFSRRLQVQERLTTQIANALKVALAARSRAELAEVAGEIRTAGGGRALAIPTDVTNDGAVEALVEQTASDLKRVDILVTAAGTASFGSLVDSKPADWDMMLSVNLRAAMVCCRAVLPTMLRQGEGTIVNVASIAAK